MAAAAGGQEASVLRVRLESVSGEAVSGALVALLDSADRVVAEGLSSEAGRRTLHAAPGVYRVRVRRIGFQPHVSAPLSLPHATEFVLRLDARPVALRSIVISARTACRRREDAAEVALVWEEIAKALRASEFTNDDLTGVGRAYSYQKEVHRDGAVTASDTVLFTVRGVRPFTAVDPAALARDGYVRGDQYRGWEYFGPDEAVLLSDGFAATHCFRLVREPERPGKLGLGFEPVPRRRIPDIAGVLWLDEASSELEVMEFAFVNAGMPTTFEAGGYTRFRRMSSGAWIVAEWRLRFPRLRVRPGALATPSLLGWRENGGGILSDGQQAGGQRVSLAGSVYDSISATPLDGATVLIHESVARTDADGRFRFERVPRGTAPVSFTHPRLSALGVLALESTGEMHEGAELVLGTPSLSTVWTWICSGASIASADRERGIIHGMLRDVAGRAVASASVRVDWSEDPSAAGGAAAHRMRINVVTDTEGRYSACGLPRGANGTVSVVSGDRALSSREFAFPRGREYYPVVRRDLIYPDVTRVVGVRSLQVQVTDPSGAPVADATVAPLGRGAQVRTDDMGRAVLRTSAAVVDVGVQRVGYAARSFRISFGDEVVSQLHVVLTPVQPADRRGSQPE